MDFLTAARSLAADTLSWLATQIDPTPPASDHAPFLGIEPTRTGFAIRVYSYDAELGTSEVATVAHGANLPEALIGAARTLNQHGIRR